MLESANLFEYCGIDKPKPKINIVKSDNLGLVYMGSKRTIAKAIVEVMHKMHPNAFAFYDMFGGGGAMSFYAKQCGYDVIYNELDTNIYKIIEFSSQGYNENDFVRLGLYEWLSREDFNRIREKVKSGVEISAVEAIKLLVYSFGCGFKSYAYGEDKEKLFKLAHNAIVNLCFDSLLELDNLFLSETNYKGFLIKLFDYLKSIDTIQERAYKFMRYDIRLVYVIANNVRVNSVQDVFNQKAYRGRENSKLAQLTTISALAQLTRLAQLERLSQLTGLAQLKALSQLTGLAQLTRLARFLQLERLSKLAQLSRLSQLKLSNKSYLDVDIPHKPSECIIYCDPPYRDTGGYAVGKFNHDLFYDWCIIQARAGFKVFVSEYDMPKSDFTEVWQSEKLVTFQKERNDLKSVEKLYLCTPQ